MANRQNSPRDARSAQAAAAPPAAAGGAGRGAAAPRNTAGPIAQRPRSRWPLVLVLVVCVLPVLASYFFYFVVKPAGGSTNYGTLVEPQRPMPAALSVRDDTGALVPLTALKGKWIMLSVDSGACATNCAKKLYFMRQVRATQGNERERIVPVWIRTDSVPVSPVIRQAYEGTRFYTGDAAALSTWLPANAGTEVSDHIYVVDPNGNLMMYFPKDADPGKIKSDMTKLLKWSGLG